MNATKVLRAGAYQPMIKFIGKHHPPPALSHAPAPHPAAPTGSLPDSFAAYRAKAQSHGPLGSGAAGAHVSAGGRSVVAHGAVGGHAGRSLGAVQPSGEGVAFDRSQLPGRFGRLALREGEMEAVESGGATMWG